MGEDPRSMKQINNNDKMKKYTPFVLLLFYGLISCRTDTPSEEDTSATDRVVTHTIKTKIPYAFQFKLKGTFIKFKVRGITENGGVLYVQSFGPNNHVQFTSVKIDKGKVNYVDKNGSETYFHNGRVIYVPNKYLNPSQNTTDIDSLNLYIETGNE